jgi:hypothetical protein
MVIAAGATFGHAAPSRTMARFGRWGSNNYGQLGNNTITSSLNAVLVPG